MKKALLAGAILALSSLSAQAHFQLIYTPELALERGKSLTLKMPFAHPGSNGGVMDMARPQSLKLIHKGKEKDLSSKLEPIGWSGGEEQAAAWQALAKLRGMGDYVYLLTPEPYLEVSEDAYIQQITKTIINVGGLPTDWENELGLKAEIVPLQAPYAVYAGGTFSGVVKSEGKPVPFAEIEVELINYKPDMQANRFDDKATYNYPSGLYETLSIRADANGTFTFGVPVAGIWGFAALGVGPDKEHKGKELSQDAVLWIEAKSLTP
ncbi:DUF4198 domain-containing protein [Marinobacterium jannaschii]|uniref:DUF4198 domain-containing protein n=1 Tax=Marinobacterium jannaschii TaxID=64970 RepID=UPI0004864654|nr:DUF4198 domain-containing protein [Marinobacterium jannaschii]